MSLLSVARGDGSLDGHTISNSLIRVDALVGFLAVEEVRNKFDNKGNMSGTTDQDDFVDIQLVDHIVAELFLIRIKSTLEGILAEFFKVGMSKGGVEINILKE